MNTLFQPELYTSLYQMDTSDTDPNVAHLFEHLVISGFFQAAEKHGFHQALIGWLGGESFNERLFIDAGFYQPKVSELFHRYMNNLPQPDDQSIRHQLSVIEAEERSLLQPHSTKQLVRQLEKLRTREWNTVFNHPVEKTQPQTIKVQKKAAAFRKIVTDIYIPINQLTQEEQFVFLRVYVLMADSIQRLLQNSYAAYEEECTDIKIRNDKMGFGVYYTIKRGVTTTNELSQTIEKLLHDFPVDKHIEQIRAHLKVFGQHRPWHYFPVDYFRETGLSPTPEMIIKLATPTAIASLFKKTVIQTVPGN